MGKAARNRVIRRYAAEKHPEGESAKSFARKLRRKKARIHDLRNS